MSKGSSSEFPNSDDARMLTATEVADRLRISVRGVWRQVSTGCMPEPVYIGRLARWPLTTISDWMKNGCPPRTEVV